MPQWKDLTPYWDSLRSVGTVIMNQKQGFSTSTPWNRQCDFIGLLAEQTYAIVTGQRVNTDIIISGDGGTDFGDVDIKGTPKWQRRGDMPHLLLNVGSPLRARIYVLVGVDMVKKRGFIFGWATREDVEKAKIKNLGNGKRYAIPWHQLRDIESLMSN